MAEQAQVPIAQASDYQVINENLPPSVATSLKPYPSTKEDIEYEEEIIKELKGVNPLDDKLRCFALNHLLLQDKQVNSELEAELAEVSQKYLLLSQPLLVRANEIISGGAINENELKNLSEYLTPEELAKKDEGLTQLKPVEGYWLKALQGSSLMKDFISAQDEDALKSLTSITFSKSDLTKPFDFELQFNFGPNDYFENTTLTKLYHMIDENDCKKTFGTEIKWKAGKNLTKKKVEKKQKNKKTGKTRTIEKEVDCTSFFGFFKTVEQNEHVHDHKDDEECDDHQHDDEMMDHIDFGKTLIDEILPYHIEYFLGVKKEFGYGQGGEDGEDDDEDDDDKSDSSGSNKGKKNKKAANKKDTKGGAPKQECKQQ